LEILFQVFIAYSVFNSQHGILLFGVLNALLITLTNSWRMVSRVNENSHMPIIGLLLFSYLSSLKCSGSIKNININVGYKNIYLVIASILGIVVSNDINFKKSNYSSSSSSK
jgi:hypothetical protein